MVDITVCAHVCMCLYSQKYVNEELLSCKYFMHIDILKMGDLGLFSEFDFSERQ